MDGRDALAAALATPDGFGWLGDRFGDEEFTPGHPYWGRKADFILAAMPDMMLVSRDEWERLRAAAQAVVDAWGADDLTLGWDGQSDYVDALRAALGGSDA